MKKKQKPIGKLYETVLIGTLLGMLVSFLLLLIMAFVLTLRDFSPAIALPLATVALGVGALLAGYYASVRYGKKGLTVGAATGGVFLLFYLGVALGLGGSFSSIALVRTVVFLLASSLGGVIGVNRKQMQKKV